MKKLPSIFRKKYTEKNLEKKIYKKLFVPDDKKYIKSLFAKVEQTDKNKSAVYAIPAEKTAALTKKDFKRLKSIAKQIKKQKGRINFVPLIASISFLVAIPVCFAIFKNVIIKKAITTVCENIFEARCDIQKVDFKFFDSSLKIKKIEIANKNDVMKNLVDIGSVSIDFDLKQLLKKRFVADELSVLDVLTGTERKYSGELPPKKIKKIKKNKEKIQKQASQSKFAIALGEKKSVASSSLQENISGLFNQINPQNLMETYYAKLQTPNLSTDVQNKVPELVEKWQSKPAEVQKSVDDLQKSVNEIMAFDYNSVQNNPLKIKEFLETIDAAYKNIEKAKKEATGTLNSFNADMAQVDSMRKTIQNAVNHDLNFANTEIAKITSLSISDGTNLISGMFEKVACDVLGKYYPYAQTGVNYLLNLKSKQQTQPAKQKSENTKKAKKQKYSIKRAPGRDIFYRSDKTPSFWIKKMAGSGANFFVNATNIANNQELINKPAKIDFNLELYDLQHTGTVVVDFRLGTTEPLVLADYNVKNVQVNIPANTFGEYPGVPSFDSDCAINAIIKIFENEDFSIEANTLLKNLKISTVPFEPDYASKIYANVMGKVNTVNAKLLGGFSESQGLKLNIASDADSQVIKALKKEMEAELSGVKENLKKELTKKINEAGGNALGQFASLDEIKKQLSGSVASTNAFEKQLNQKKAEAEKQLKSKAADSAKKELQNQLKKLF